MKKIITLLALTIVIWGICQQNQYQVKMNPISQAKHYTFKLSDHVIREKVTFKNRYGIILTGDLYIPKNHDNKPLPALPYADLLGLLKNKHRDYMQIKWQNEVLSH
jgi:uncharacterized protein